MDQSLFSLSFKGSILEAIYEAKLQKKLFVVYISGEDEKSVEMESSTWRSHNVSESISKYCVLLHLQEGSPDAINFSKLYPQNSVPCITAVGFNGVKLWQIEGYITAEALASGLEKAWLSLHIQETTASVLTAALAGQKPEPPNAEAEASRVTSEADQGSSSITAAADRTDVHDGDSKVEPLPSSKKAVEKEGSGEAVDTKKSDEASSRSNTVTDAENVSGKNATGEARLPKPRSADLKNLGDDPKMTADAEVDSLPSSKKAAEKEGSAETVETKKCDGAPSSSNTVTGAEDVLGKNTTGEARLPKPRSADLRNLGDDPKMTSDAEGPHKRGADKECLSEIKEGPMLNVSSSNATLADRQSAHIDDRNEVSVGLNPNRKMSSDVHLNIRLPSGVSLQEKFTLTSTLSMVKDYVDKNHSGELRNYDLATPYPRKIFNDQDLSKSLLDLELCGRQALIVVPRVRGKDYGGGPSFYNNATNSSIDSSSGSIGGYFGLVRRLLSYVNPFSYLGGSPQSSISEPESEESRQYRPYPTQDRRTERPSSQASVNQDTSSAGGSQVRSRKPVSSQFGSNIHTLKHDEDERFSERNQFWNGNSTQYGGDGDEK